MKYLEYPFYQDNYGGVAVSEAEFNKYELKARYVLDGFTLKPRKTLELLKGTEHNERIQLTMCELIDNTKKSEEIVAMAEKGHRLQFSGKVSETVKDHTISINQKHDIMLEALNFINSTDLSIVYKYLIPTGLLYRGV